MQSHLQSTLELLVITNIRWASELHFCDFAFSWSWFSAWSTFSATFSRSVEEGAGGEGEEKKYIFCFHHVWVYTYTRGKYTCRKRKLNYQFKVKHALESSRSIKIIDVFMLVARNIKVWMFLSQKNIHSLFYIVFSLSYVGVNGINSNVREVLMC